MAASEVELVTLLEELPSQEFQGLGPHQGAMREGHSAYAFGLGA